VVKSVRFSSNGELLASSGQDRAVCLWSKLELPWCQEKWVLIYRFAISNPLLLAQNAYLRGTKNLSDLNYKLLKQRGANHDQIPPIQQFSLVMMRIWNSFFTVTEKDYELSLIGQRIALYLSERDHQSMSCANRACFGFFTQLRSQRKPSTDYQISTNSFMVGSVSPLQPSSVPSESNLTHEEYKQKFGCSICQLL